MSDDNAAPQHDPSADRTATAPATGLPPGGSRGQEAAAGAVPEAPRRPWRLLSSVVPVLALLLAAVALVVSAILRSQWQVGSAVLENAAAEQRLAIESATAELAQLTESTSALEREIATNQDRFAAVRLEIADFPAQLAALGRRLDAVQGSRLEAREIWLRAEAEYYLAIANAELELNGRVETAVTALTLADGLLRELGSPALNPVRVAIAEELAGLRALAEPDTEGLVFSLASLARQVPGLPVRSGGASNYQPEGPALDSMESGLARLWASVRGAVLGIVRVERSDVPVPAMLSAAEQELARRQLVLELQLARIALLRGETAAFRTSLAAARDLLERDFEREAAGVASAMTQLDEMIRLDIAPERPDISGSLSLLRAAPEGAG